MKNQLFIEAFVVGIITVIVGTAVSYLFFNVRKGKQSWKRNYGMEIALFLTGVFIHLICEFTGINKWYCKNGNACKN